MQVEKDLMVDRQISIDHDKGKSMPYSNCASVGSLLCFIDTASINIGQKMPEFIDPPDGPVYGGASSDKNYRGTSKVDTVPSLDDLMDEDRLSPGEKRQYSSLYPC